MGGQQPCLGDHSKFQVSSIKWVPLPQGHHHAPFHLQEGQRCKQVQSKKFYFKKWHRNYTFHSGYTPSIYMMSSLIY